MRRRFALALGLLVLALLVVPASATQEPVGCHTFVLGLVTPVTPLGCETQVTCGLPQGACAYELYVDTEGGGMVGVHGTVDGATVASCGPLFGLCSTIGTFSVPAGHTARVRCSTGPLSAALVAELDCNVNPVA